MVRPTSGLFPDVTSFRLSQRISPSDKLCPGFRAALVSGRGFEPLNATVKGW